MDQALESMLHKLSDNNPQGYNFDQLKCILLDIDWHKSIEMGVYNKVKYLDNYCFDNKADIFRKKLRYHESFFYKLNLVCRTKLLK